jgi:hypothetical protein
VPCTTDLAARPTGPACVVPGVAGLEAQAAGETERARKPRTRPAGISPMEAAEILRMATEKVRRLVDNYIAWCEANGFDPVADNSPAVLDDEHYLKGWRVEKEAAERVECCGDAADVTRRMGKKGTGLPCQRHPEVPTSADRS